MLKIDGKKVTRTQDIEVGGLPEAAQFTPDGKYLLVGNYLDQEVEKLAAILAGNAPVAMAGMKRAINEFARGKLDEEAADRRARDSMRGTEIKEGIKAFAEKRPPKF